jgi:hypothetical protein
LVELFTNILVQPSLCHQYIGKSNDAGKGLFRIFRNVNSRRYESPFSVKITCLAGQDAAPHQPSSDQPHF